MDSETEMNHYGRSAMRDVERAYLNLAEDDYELPTYDVTNDRFIPPSERKRKGKPKKSKFDELKRKYNEYRDKYKVSDVSDEDELPVYHVTHDELAEKAVDPSKLPRKEEMKPV